MVNTKLLVGIGFLGVAVYAYSQLEMPTTTNGDLSPNGDDQYVSPNGNGDDDTDALDCSPMWDASGNRINDNWVNHGEISFGPDKRRTCSLNGFDVRVYTDKLVYHAGESIKVLILKKYYVWNTIGEKKWKKWNNQRTHRRHSWATLEKLAFLLGVEGDKVLKQFSPTNVTTVSLPSNFNSVNDTEANTYGIGVYKIRTTSQDEGTYDLTFAAEVGPYKSLSTCGGSQCLANSKKDCNVRKSTSSQKIVVLSKDCKNPPQASSAETGRSFFRGRFKKPHPNERERQFDYGENPKHGDDPNSRTYNPQHYYGIFKYLIKEPSGRDSENWISSQSFLTEWV